MCAGAGLYRARRPPLFVLGSLGVALAITLPGARLRRGMRKLYKPPAESPQPRPQ
ncbi:MAG: hypothetical protein HY558_02860 [Euryarchaeota archaeon]|nr:hypothetical protein [Euryarchaeota archaeon]